MENPEATIAHMKNALENVQGNIRHIDTKVAGAMGLVAVVLGFCVSRSILADQLRFSGPVSPWFRNLELILLIGAVLALVLAVYFASKTLFPRMGSDSRLKRKTWLLFPLAKSDGDAVVLRDTLETKATKGLSYEAIVEEYLDQLAITGHIQTQKMDACKSLFKCVWVFCGIMLLLGATSLLCHMHVPLPSACDSFRPPPVWTRPSRLWTSVASTVALPTRATMSATWSLPSCWCLPPPWRASVSSGDAGGVPCPGEEFWWCWWYGRE